MPPSWCYGCGIHTVHGEKNRKSEFGMGKTPILPPSIATRPFVRQSSFVWVVSPTFWAFVRKSCTFYSAAWFLSVSKLRSKIVIPQVSGDISSDRTQIQITNFGTVVLVELITTQYTNTCITIWRSSRKLHQWWKRKVVIPSALTEHKRIDMEHLLFYYLSLFWSDDLL